VIAKNLARDNYRLLLFGKILNPLADIECLHCVVDASWEADIIISAVPAGTETQLAEKIREVATQKILLIVSNPQERAAADHTHSKSGVEEIQKLLPNSKVVKTFSTKFAVDFARAVAGGHSIDALTTGNDLQTIQQ
jgi:predicted dinucleotide-binding enzyme